MYPQSKLLWRSSPPVDAPKSGGLPPGRPHCTRRDCIPQLVSLAAQLNPNAAALVAGTSTMCYSALETRSDRLAAYLRSIGVTRDVAVAVCLDRSPDSVTSALAIWKAGGICIPIDPAWPADFREAVIDDAQAVILVTRRVYSPGVRFTVDLDHDDAAIAREHTVFTPPATRRESLAYIVYPGGNLVGVEVTHGNLLNLAFWHRRAFDVTSADRGACLDGLRCAAVEVWPYLTSGASVAIADAPASLREWIASAGVTLAFLPGDLAVPLVSQPWPGRTALRQVLVDAPVKPALRDLPFQVAATYGSVESTMVAVCGGKPLDHGWVHILDWNREPVVYGATGEIYVGGPCVARGYRRRPELTAERFFEDPYSTVPGARMFRTGDFGRILPDGRLALENRPS